MSSTALSSLTEGRAAKVTAVNLKGSIRRRLMDMGLIEGTRVICLHISPAGDPVAYLIRGAVVALRKEDAEKILIG